MLSAVLEDQEGEPVRLELMGDGFYLLCQRDSTNPQIEHKVVLTESQIAILNSFLNISSTTSLG